MENWPELKGSNPQLVELASQRRSAAHEKTADIMREARRLQNRALDGADSLAYRWAFKEAIADVFKSREAVFWIRLKDIEREIYRRVLANPSARRAIGILSNEGRLSPVMRDEQRKSPQWNV